MASFALTRAIATDETIAAASAPPRREWLVTNGLGGYASGTVAGVVTRRYHGLLVASLPAPLGRMVMLNHLLERVRLPGRGVIWLGDEDEVAGPERRRSAPSTSRSSVSSSACRCGSTASTAFTIEKRVLMPHGQNTVHVTYRVLEGDGTGALQPAAVGALPRLRGAGRRSRRPGRTRSPRRGSRYELSARHRSCRCCG